MKNAKENGAKFSKAELLKAKRYATCRDILSAILCDSTMYSHEDVEKLIKEFREREVN